MNQEQVWDAIAEKWASYRDKPTDEVVRFLKGKSGRVLDLGCGSGRHFLKSDDLDFYGVDFSKKLLELAEEKGYVELKKGRAGAIPYEDGFFDYVVFSRVLHCLDKEERVKALGEILRVLRKGGEALISTWGEKGCLRLKGEREGFVSWDVGDKKVERYTYVYDEGEFRDELRKVGFRILSFEVGRNLVAVVGK